MNEEKESQPEDMNPDKRPVQNAESLFEKIRKMQSLPESVVQDFLNCRSSLSATDFKDKFLKNAR